MMKSDLPLAPPHAGRPSPRELAPPFILPREHFIAGLFWLAVGSAGLIAVAPALAGGGIFSPRVIAVTHCFTLGWITTSIFGALYQIFPIALGVPARSVQVGHVTFVVLQAGILALVAGSWTWLIPLIAAGWVVLFLAVGGLAWNILPQRRKAPRGHVIGLYVSGGHMALGLAMLVIAARIGAELGWWHIDRIGFLVAHAHLAVVGFASLTVVGVGSRLFPMFLLSREHPEWPLRSIGPAVGAGLLLFSIGELIRVAALSLTGGILMAAGVALYLYLAIGYFTHRTRRVLDPGLGLVAAAVLWLAVATLLGLIALLAHGFHPRLAAAYGIAGIVGWLSLLVAGMYHKIVAFLTWLHRFSDRVGEPGVPRVADLTSPAAGWITVAFSMCGVAILIAGVLAGDEPITRSGALAFGAGTLILLGQQLYLMVRQ